MKNGRHTMLPVLAVGYLVASFAVPSGAAAVQQWVSVLYGASYENPAGGDLFLPGGTLDPADLLAGLGGNTKVVIGASISIELPGAVTGTAQISNAVEVTASVEGKKKRKVLARLKGTLAQGQGDFRKTVSAKKLIDKGAVTFETSTSNALVAAYNADVTYYIALAAGLARGADQR